MAAFYLKYDFNSRVAFGAPPPTADQCDNWNFQWALLTGNAEAGLVERQLSIEPVFTQVKLMLVKITETARVDQARL